MLFVESSFCRAFPIESRDPHCQKLFRNLCKLYEFCRQRSMNSTLGREKLKIENQRNVVFGIPTGIH